MSKAVLISIRPKWCELIASGHKTIEVRKTRPKIKTPFKCYIYEAKGKVERPCGDEDGYIYQEGRGAVVGEFVCDRITDIFLTDEGYDFDVPKMTCMKYEEMEAYLGRKNGYGWHISALKVYDKPKDLSEFQLYYSRAIYENGFPMPTKEINRPPQSYCYVEELP